MQKWVCGLAGAALKATVLAVALSGSAANAAGIVNGGFETGLLSPWTSSGPVGVIGSGLAPEGGRVAVIGFDAFFTSAPTTLSQSFTTAADGQFDYAFKAGRAEVAGPFNDVALTFAARIDGILLSDLLPAFDGGSGGAPVSTHLSSDYAGSLFLAQGAHDLTFQFTRGATLFGRGPYFVLDGVSVQAQAAPPGPGVPEPATWAMMITGFGLAGAALRRRNRVLVVQG